MEALVNINGQITSPEEAKVSVFDRGFLFGDGVYETGRSHERCCLYLDEHIARLHRSAEKLSIPFRTSDAELKDQLYKTARAFKKDALYYRIILTRGPISHVGLDILEEVKPTLVYIVQSLSANLEALRARGLRLMTSKIIRNAIAAQDPNIKTSNYLNSLLALQDVKARGGEDAVMCDSQGNVAEGTTFAVFGVSREGGLVTSSLEVGLLDSITRRKVLGLARKFLKVEEGFIPLDRFQNCAEIFIASSLRDILPVSEWDGKKYPAMGPVTRKLYEQFQAELAAYVSSHEKY